MDTDFGGDFDAGGGNFDSGGSFDSADTSFDTSDTSVDVSSDVSSDLSDTGNFDGDLASDLSSDVSTDMFPGELDTVSNEPDLGQDARLEAGDVTDSAADNFSDLDSALDDSAQATSSDISAELDSANNSADDSIEPAVTDTLSGSDSDTESSNDESALSRDGDTGEEFGADADQSTDLAGDGDNQEAGSGADETGRWMDSGSSAGDIDAYQKIDLGSDLQPDGENVVADSDLTDDATAETMTGSDAYEDDQVSASNSNESLAGDANVDQEVDPGSDSQGDIENDDIDSGETGDVGTINGSDSDESGQGFVSNADGIGANEDANANQQNSFSDADAGANDVDSNNDNQDAGQNNGVDDAASSSGASQHESDADSPAGISSSNATSGSDSNRDNAAEADDANGAMISNQAFSGVGEGYESTREGSPADITSSGEKNAGDGARDDPSGRDSAPDSVSDRINADETTGSSTDNSTGIVGKENVGSSVVSEHDDSADQNVGSGHQAGESNLSDDHQSDMNRSVGMDQSTGTLYADGYEKTEQDVSGIGDRENVGPLASHLEDKTDVYADKTGVAPDDEYVKQPSTDSDAGVAGKDQLGASLGNNGPDDRLPVGEGGKPALTDNSDPDRKGADDVNSPNRTDNLMDKSIDQLPGQPTDLFQNGGMNGNNVLHQDVLGNEYGNDNGLKSTQPGEVLSTRTDADHRSTDKLANDGGYNREPNDNTGLGQKDSLVESQEAGRQRQAPQETDRTGEQQGPGSEKNIQVDEITDVNSKTAFAPASTVELNQSKTQALGCDMPLETAPPALVEKNDYVDKVLADASAGGTSGGGNPPLGGDPPNNDGLPNKSSNQNTGEISTNQLSTNDSLPNQVQPTEEVKMEEREPNTLYERNGYYFRTDELGRPTGVYGKLELQEGTRSDEQTKIGHMGLEDDEGGHLIGTRFNGPADAFNLVPQNFNLNRGAWKTMENEWESAIKSGCDVIAQIEPVYDDDSIRPAFFKVNYTYTDKVTGESFPAIVNLFLNKSNKE